MRVYARYSLVEIFDVISTVWCGVFLELWTVTPLSKQARVTPKKATVQRGGLQFLILSVKIIFVDHPSASHNVGIQCAIYIHGLFKL
jgi:hypothetical protein